ncbi:MAG TPA: hypothetical protein PJ982_00070 [Lacipirellulaceae bacterium]|nr:hypothetical protein [Lacipirellulaceae bacterium]
MARFSVRPTQQQPRNVFIALETLQDLIDYPSRVNAAALATESSRGTSPVPEAAREEVFAALHPELEDFGLLVETVSATGEGSAGYVRVSADRLVLPLAVVGAAERLYADRLQPAITYLANSISANGRSIPYSTITGVDSTDRWGPVRDPAGRAIRLSESDIALNQWAADQLNAAVGEEITVSYYEPETTHGELREAPRLRLVLQAIVPLQDEQGMPTLAADPRFAPDLPGVTDQASIDAWKLPFELVEPIRPEDESYWDEYRTTPKAFISHDLAQRIWRTRWGSESVLRLQPAPNETASTIAAELRSAIDPLAMGLTLLPAKQNAIAAAAGTTPFEALFLGFSFFLMASALMLTALLFRLGVDQRAPEVGLLLAVGVSPAVVRSLLLREGLVVAVGGATVGAALGIVYALIMINGLNTWWVDATVEPFVEFHSSWRIALGFIAGLAAALAAIVWTLRTIAALPPRALLAGIHTLNQPTPVRFLRARKWLPAVLWTISSVLGVGAATVWDGEAQSGAFFGAGAAALAGGIALIGNKLRETRHATLRRLALSGLAARNIRRTPGRSMLAIALAATASFLIVALSAFRVAPTQRGTGEFDLIATSDLPVHYDLNTAEGRRQLGFAPDDARQIEDCEFVSFRVRDGEDASCLNLYQTAQPRVLGTPAGRSALDGFSLIASPPAMTGSPRGQATAKSPWDLLEAPLGRDEQARPIVPMILDRATANYGLKLYRLGDRLTIQDTANRPITLSLVGLVSNSILQGSILIGESHFLSLYPETAGHRFFLIRRGAKSPPAGELAALLETQLEDFGFDANDAATRLGELLAVQNTYLSTFQSLGVLGLLLGAVGLAVAQLRSVLERRSELALMQAAGFHRQRLAHMVLAENLALLFGGLAIGSLAALVAVMPHAALQQLGPPWGTLALLIGAVGLCGCMAGWVASRVVLRAPLVQALRGE